MALACIIFTAIGFCLGLAAHLVITAGNARHDKRMEAMLRGIGAPTELPWRRS